MSVDSKHQVSREKADKMSAAPKLKARDWARWIWGQLTTMRMALFLLMLLAVAAVPGSFFPQRTANPQLVERYVKEHPGIGEFLDRLQAFDVYDSAWFSAVYLLLFVSLIGCVVPRAIRHVRLMVRKPPRTPQYLSRLPEHGVVRLANSAGLSREDVAGRVRRILRRRKLRTHRYDDSAGVASIAAESTMLREIGNIIFHISLIGVLVFNAVNGLLGYSGQRVIVEGETFVNSLIGYDDFRSGRNFSPENLDPFALTLDKFIVRYDTAYDRFGSPIYYRADMRVKEGPKEEGGEKPLSVNHPLRIGDSSVYLAGNGYAPVVTVHDGNAKVVYQGPVVTLPQSDRMDSQFVLKVPDAAPQQLGFYGFFLPSARKQPNGAANSIFPDLMNPELHLDSYYGDLGLDGGRTQSVYDFNTEGLEELNSRNSRYGGIVVGVGGTYKLPENKGSISFDGVKRYIVVNVGHAPGKAGILWSAVIGIVGLAFSLFVGRRRVWVKIIGTGDEITMEYGLLARGEDFRLAHEARLLEARLQQVG